MSKEIAISYIDQIAPEHSRTSCAEFDSWNAAFTLQGVLHNKCERCTLIRIAQLATGEVEPRSEEDES